MHFINPENEWTSKISAWAQDNRTEYILSSADRSVYPLGRAGKALEILFPKVDWHVRHLSSHPGSAVKLQCSTPFGSQGIFNYVLHSRHANPKNTETTTG